VPGRRNRREERAHGDITARYVGIVAVLPSGSKADGIIESIFIRRR